MGVCVQEGQLHALTEYISGGSLEQLLANTEVDLTAVMKMRLALGIARGMAYVHDVGIFHRDLTSKNVLIRDLPDGTFDAVVGDFGLAAKIPDKKVKQRLDTVGSPYWVSPECLKGQWYDQTSDVFSFGIIQCEIIARIEADPDIMPRTDSFGLDYLAFVELCPMDTPPVFLRLAFYCCIYDPKSRPTFHEAAKKLALLVDKYQQVHSDNGSNSPLSSLELNGSSPIGSDAEGLTPETLINHRQALKKYHAPIGLQQVNENGFNFSATSSGMNSSSSTTLTADELDDSILKPGVLLLFDTETLAQQHRRSLSENIIHFPLHTTPSDKARCHQMQRQRSSTHSPTPPPKSAAAINTTILEQQAADVKISNVLTLRKVAETMCLKDVQYKPIRLDHNGVKSNPFTAMAQLRGVKKILGANPKSYAAGVGDLFSSCFEMSAPFFKEALQKTAAMAGENISTCAPAVSIKAGKLVVAPVNAPKSLPTSPQLSRRFSNIDIKLSPTLPTRLLTGEAAQLVAADEEDDCEDCASDAEQDADGGGNCADAESSSDDSADRPATSSARKYRANSLYTHPLFRSTGGVGGGGGCASSKSDEVISALLTPTANVDDTNSSEDGAEKSAVKSRPVSVSAPTPPTPPPPPPSAPSIATPASISSSTDFELHEVKSCDFMPPKSTLTRRDSIESGFYSCFNEESDAAINPTYKHFNPSSLALSCGGNCCFEQLKAQMVLDSTAPEELR